MLNEAISVAIVGAIGAAIVAYINKPKAEEEEATPEYPPLALHPVQTKIKLLQNKVVLDLEMDSEGRQLIAKDILTHKLVACETAYRELAAEHDERTKTCTRDCANCQWVYVRHVEAIDTILQHCRTYYKNDSYTAEEQAILDLVWAQFNHYHHPNVNRLLESAERTTNSKFYKDCRVQSSIIMDQVSAVLGDVIMDAEQTFSAINGQLTGRGPFRGVIVDYEKLAREETC